MCIYIYNIYDVLRKGLFFRPRWVFISILKKIVCGTKSADAFRIYGWDWSGSKETKETSNDPKRGHMWYLHRFKPETWKRRWKCTQTSLVQQTVQLTVPRRCFFFCARLHKYESRWSLVTESGSEIKPASRKSHVSMLMTLTADAYD